MILFTVSMLAGLALFLYAATSMTASLQRLAGVHLKTLLQAATANRFLGVLSGALGTAIVQSSSVISVMAVSFVNAGLITLPRSISLILGSHIGTTVTAQLIAFRLEYFIFPLIAGGGGLYILAHSPRIKEAGQTLLNFGLIFLGLQIMSQAIAPIQSQPVFQELLTEFTQHPWKGFFVGIFITMLFQSSTVTTGLTIALAVASAITFEQAVPLIIGENVGTTITANIASISASRVAKQTARAHFITHAITAVLVLSTLPYFITVVKMISPITDDARQIANAHTLFNILGTILFLPFIATVARITEYLVKTKTVPEPLAYLEQATLQEPSTALDLARQGLADFLNQTKSYFLLLQEWLSSLKKDPSFTLNEKREKIEHMADTITTFLEATVSLKTGPQESRLIPAYIRILHEMERINDYEEKIRLVLRQLAESDKRLGTTEHRELVALLNTVEVILEKTEHLLRKKEKQGDIILEMYESLQAEKERLRLRSTKRIIQRHTALAVANFYFDIVSSCEEIGRKCRNIAVALK